MGDVAKIQLCTWTKSSNRSARDVLKTYVGLFVMLHLVLRTEASSFSKSCDKNCFSGKCINGTCVCDYGWVGDQCQHCQGRFK